MPFLGFDSSPNINFDSCLKPWLPMPWFDHQPRKFPWLVVVSTMQPYGVGLRILVFSLCSLRIDIYPFHIGLSPCLRKFH